MRLLAVTSSYPKWPGDVTAPFIESITRALVRRGHRIDVILPEHPQLARPKEPGIGFFPYRYAPSPRLALWGYAQSLVADVRLKRTVVALAPLVALSLRRTAAALLRDRPYDAALLHWVVPNAVLVADLLRTCRTPYVVSLHGSDVFVAERNRFVGLAARAAFAGAGAVTACSGDLLSRALSLGAPPGRSRTVPYGVDAAAFSESSPDGDDAAARFRARLGLRPSDVLVLAVGRLVEKKGFRFLVEAAARHPELRVLIAGAGDLASDLRDRATSLGASVTLVGAVDRDTVALALRAADIVAVPSVVDSAGNVDGLPNALLEALAAGRAVVASQVAGIPDVVIDGANGLLVPPGDAPALAAALGRLASDAPLRARLGAQARERAARELTWGHHAAILEECLVQATTLATR